jgi:cytochrome c556
MLAVTRNFSAWVNKRVFAALICSACSALVVNAADDKINPELVVKHRQAVMMAIGGHTSATFGAMSLPEFADQQLYHLEQINKLAKMSAQTFTAGSNTGKTKSKGEVWSKPDEFKQAMDDFLLKSDTAVAEAKKGTKEKEYLAAVKALTESCKACHKKFKED